MATDAECARRIAANIEVLKANTGALMQRSSGFQLEVSAFYSGMVNGVVLSDTTYLTPNPWGPVVGGKDIFAAAATACTLRQASMSLLIGD
ncbi:protein-arginine deiminase [Colletotrichum tofieldiae]|nr:protein-arginine deiminase [Colletotrichum tofieldiae]GKT81273.1 protein-arginine deiminase [Colletotrichum tofieldiae]GKT83949.1 protein-arginine deiminase [Colletotrichum tofieldiae]